MKKRTMLISLLAALLICSLSACAQLSEARAVRELEAEISALPLSPLKSFMTSDSELAPKPEAGAVTMTYYLYGGSNSMEFAMTLNDEVLTEEITYNLVLASMESTDFQLELFLDDGSGRTLIGSDSFTVASSYYERYRGVLHGVSEYAGGGAELILVIEASGSDFGINLSNKSYISVFEPEPLDEEVARQRLHLLSWAAQNIDVPEADRLMNDIFLDIFGNLDAAIAAGDDAVWTLGWGLTVSEEPFVLSWTDKEFSVESITEEAAIEAGVEAQSVNYTRTMN